MNKNIRKSIPISLGASGSVLAATYMYQKKKKNELLAKKRKSKVNILPGFLDVIHVDKKHDKMNDIIQTIPKGDALRAVNKASITNLPSAILENVIGSYLNTGDVISYSKIKTDPKTAERMLVHSIAKNSQRYWAFLQALNDTSPNISERAKVAREICSVTTKSFINDALEHANSLYEPNSLIFMFIDLISNVNPGIPAGTFPNTSYNYTSKFVYRQDKRRQDSDSAIYYNWYGHTKEWGAHISTLTDKSHLLSEHEVINYICSNYMYVVDVYIESNEMVGDGVHVYGTTRPRDGNKYISILPLTTGPD
jgi:hypothetical protein